MKLNEKILYYRKAARLSQEELAARVGVSRQSVSKWELDGATPEVDRLLSLARVFGITTDELLSDEPPAGSGPAPEQEQVSPERETAPAEQEQASAEQVPAAAEQGPAPGGPARPERPDPLARLRRLAGWRGWRAGLFAALAGACGLLLCARLFGLYPALFWGDTATPTSSAPVVVQDMPLTEGAWMEPEEEPYAILEDGMEAEYGYLVLPGYEETDTVELVYQSPAHEPDLPVRLLGGLCAGALLTGGMLVLAGTACQIVLSFRERHQKKY